MTDRRDKSWSRPGRYGGFDSGVVTGVNGDDVTVSIPRISDDFDIPLTAHVGAIPEVGSEAFVAMLHDSFGEFAAIFPGGSGGGKIAVDFLVAAYNARDEIKAVADFVCDGDHDEVEIQAAIDAVLTGNYGLNGNSGKIVLSSGYFDIGAPIKTTAVAESLIIEGGGMEATSIWCDYEVPAGTTAAIDFAKVDRLTLRNLGLYYYGDVPVESPFYLLDAGFWSTVVLEGAILNIYDYYDPNENLRGVASRYLYAHNCELSADGNTITNSIGTYVDGCLMWSEFGSIIADGSIYSAHTVRARNTEFYSGGDGIHTREGRTNVIIGCIFYVKGVAIFIGENGIGQGDFVDGNWFTRGGNTDIPNEEMEIFERPQISINEGYNVYITGNIFEESAPWLDAGWNYPGPWIANGYGYDYDQSYPAPYANDLHIVGNSFSGGSGIDLTGNDQYPGGYALQVDGNAMYCRKSTTGLNVVWYEHCEITNNVFYPLKDDIELGAFTPMVLDHMGQFIVNANIVVANRLA